MRLWTLHPKYLDTGGLTALWREALGAQRCILGLCGQAPLAKGYNNHPQLKRFMRSEEPIESIRLYLNFIQMYATKERGWAFDKNKIYKIDSKPIKAVSCIPVTCGQVIYEAKLLNHKVSKRTPDSFLNFLGINKIIFGSNWLSLELHPLFVTTSDHKTEPWETVKDF